MARMTKSNHKAIAESLRIARRKIYDTERPEVIKDMWDGMNYGIDYMVDVFRANNPAFDADAFRTASGYYMIPTR